MEKNKLFILGAGISGLTAGIYGLKNGFDVTIIDKNKVPGGLVAAYYKDGYKIDLCLHWLTGTGDKTTAHQIWRDIGAIDDNPSFYTFDDLITVEEERNIYRLSRNIDENEKEWLLLAPEDKKHIRKFFKYVRKYAKKYHHKQNKFQKIWSYILLGPLILKTSRISRFEFASRFKNKGLQMLFINAQAGFNALYGLIYEYSLFITGNADVPKEGSDGFIKKIVDNYLSLGGKLILSEEVETLDIEDNAVRRIATNKNVYQPDYVISTISPYLLFDKLLPAGFRDKKYESKLKNQEKEESFIPTLFGVIFLIDTDLVNNLQIPYCFRCDNFKIATKEFSSIPLRSYHYSSLHNKNGKTTINVLFDLDFRDFAYFSALDENRYIQEKQDIANIVKELIIRKFPTFKGKIKVLDTFTPLTIYKYSYSPYGGYMSFSVSKKGGMFTHSQKVKCINNLLVAGQWRASVGGTPLAALSGKNAIKLLTKKNNCGNV